MLDSEEEIYEGTITKLGYEKSSMDITLSDGHRFTMIDTPETQYTRLKRAKSENSRIRVTAVGIESKISILPDTL